ncbi:MAG: magnesium transporter [Clostridia bacterium]|nr:magnesium transporter [Clostridia bacterium]
MDRDALAAVAKEWETAIAERRYADFRVEVSRYHESEIAEIFECISEEYESRAFRLLTKEQAAEVFLTFDPDRMERIISIVSDAELANMLEEMYLDDTVDIIEEMPAYVVKRIMRNSTKEDRASLARLLRYPKDSAGAIMTTEYVRFRPEQTVEDALTHIRRVAIDKETIYTAYVTDKERHLLGIVTAKQLLISPTDTLLADIMEEHVISVTTAEDKEAVAMKFDKYGFLALPVVDAENRLVGIVTVDDAMDVLREEVEEDIAKMAGMSPAEVPYLKASVRSLFLSRVPWLLLLMISATFSSTILNFFEAALPAVLVLFVPMLMDTGGNSGGQASVTLIRGLSLGEVSGRDTLRILYKEVCVGLLCGLAVGAAAFLKVMLIDHFLMANPAVTVSVALAVALAMLVTVLIAKLIGCLLPLLAVRLHLDPAVMASPFITTIVDALALLMYFFIASTLL